MAADGVTGQPGSEAPRGTLAPPGVLRARVDRARLQMVAAAGGTVEQAWDMALRRAAQDTIALRIDVISCHLRRLSLTELLELPGARSLIGILDGPAEALGVIVVSPEMLSGLVEVQTVGAVTSHAPMARKPTRTDAAMVAGFFDRALAELHLLLAAEPERVWAAGFRYASFLDDPRPLALMLEDTAWQVLEAEVSMGGGVKSGRILLALPAGGRRAKGAEPEAQTAQSDAHFNTDLREQLGQATATLDAVLVRMQVDLSELLGLGVEDVLPLFGGSLETVQLETLDGRRVATARLGQARGMRALRILRLDGEVPEDAPGDPLLALSQHQFTPHGQPQVPAFALTAEERAANNPASMSDLMSGLMADMDEQYLPITDQIYDVNP